MRFPKIELKEWLGFWGIVGLTLVFIGLVVVQLSQEMATPEPSSAIETPTSSDTVTSTVPGPEDISIGHTLTEYPYKELNGLPEQTLVDAANNEEQAPATTSTLYTNAEYGFSMQIPFNPDWGYAGYRLNPIDEVNDIENYFGTLRIIPFEGCCIIQRDFSMSILPTRSVGEIRASEPTTTKLTVTTVNGFTVVQEMDLCTDPNRAFGLEDNECAWQTAPSYEVLLDRTNLLFKNQNLNQDAVLRDVIKSISAHPSKPPESSDSCTYYGGGESDNAPPVTSYSTYTDPDTSVMFNVPFNSAWGVACPRIEIVHDDGRVIITFGPLVGAEGGDTRDTALTIDTPTSSETALEQIKQYLQGTENPNTKITKRIINGMTVYRYTVNFGLGGYNAWKVIGQNHTYTLDSLWWLTDAEAIKIIKSLKATK